MTGTLYAAIMAVLAIITGLYLLSIGFALHTPRFRRPLASETLAKLRVWSKVAGVASLLLGALYFFAALPPQ
jgi:hypothetical protein